MFPMSAFEPRDTQHAVVSTGASAKWSTLDRAQLEEKEERSHGFPRSQTPDPSPLPWELQGIGASGKGLIDPSATLGIHPPQNARSAQHLTDRAPAHGIIYDEPLPAVRISTQPDMISIRAPSPGIACKKTEAPSGDTNGNIGESAVRNIDGAGKDASDHGWNVSGQRGNRETPRLYEGPVVTRGAVEPSSVFPLQEVSLPQSPQHAEFRGKLADSLETAQTKLAELRRRLFDGGNSFDSQAQPRTVEFTNQDKQGLQDELSKMKKWEREIGVTGRPVGKETKRGSSNKLLRRKGPRRSRNRRREHSATRERSRAVSQDDSDSSSLYSLESWPDSDSDSVTYFDRSAYYPKVALPIRPNSTGPGLQAKESSRDLGIDANRMSAPELRRILFQHGVMFNRSADKPVLLGLFNDFVVPQLQGAQAQTQRSMRGTEDVPIQDQTFTPAWGKWESYASCSGR